MIGFIDRQEFETDTRCRDDCPRDIPAGLVCAPHARDFPHCIHFGVGWESQDRACRMPPGCGNGCPIDTPGMQCAEHGYIWEHCPHRHSPGQCWKGDAPGEIRTRNYHDHDYHLFATREAAEDYLFHWERERERKRQEREPEPELKQLRREMADAHPDRGGTNEEFMAARERYERALRKAS